MSARLPSSDRHPYGTRPDLHTVVSPRLQCASRPPFLQAFVSLTSTSSLQTFIPPCLPVATPTARLQISIPPHLRIATTAAHLQISRPLYFQICTPAARLQRSIPPCLQVCTPAVRLHCAMAPCIYVYAPAARLESSRALEANRGNAGSAPPVLHTSMPPCHDSAPAVHLPEFRSSILPRLEVQNFMPLFLHVVTTTTRIPSLPPHLHVFSAPREFHTVIPPRRYAYKRAPRLAELYTAISPHL